MQKFTPSSWKLDNKMYHKAMDEPNWLNMHDFVRNYEAVMIRKNNLEGRE